MVILSKLGQPLHHLSRYVSLVPTPFRSPAIVADHLLLMFMAIMIGNLFFSHIQFKSKVNLHDSPSDWAKSKLFIPSVSNLCPAGILGPIPEKHLTHQNYKALLRLCPRCLALAHERPICSASLRYRRCLLFGHDSGHCPAIARSSRHYTQLKSSTPPTSGLQLPLRL